MTTYLAAASCDGAIILTTPQEMALLDVRKEVTFCRKINLPVLGVVENMAGFVCPKCKTETAIFPPTTGGAAKMCEDMGVAFLGSLPLVCVGERIVCVCVCVCARARAHVRRMKCARKGDVSDASMNHDTGS